MKRNLENDFQKETELRKYEVIAGISLSHVVFL